mgnify:CR=1 FL=1
MDEPSQCDTCQHCMRYIYAVEIGNAKERPWKHRPYDHPVQDVDVGLEYEERTTYRCLILGHEPPDLVRSCNRYKSEGV